MSAMGERYGHQLAQGLVQAGQNIEQGLHRTATNRQLKGLGTSLMTVSPDSPDFPQKTIGIASQYPLAMQDPRGQFLVALGAKQHAAWQQQQQAQNRFGNQVSLENLRYRHGLNRIDAAAAAKANNDVDLSGLGAPAAQASPMRPPGMMSFGGAPVPLPDAAPQGDESAPLFGMSGGLAENADPLAMRALRPLADAQRLTGTKPTKTQVFGAISAERSRAQQQAMQDDRQAASEVTAAKRDEARAQTEEARATRAETTQQRLILNSQLSGIERDISRHTAALQKHLSRRKDLDKTLAQLNDDGKRQEAEQALKAWEGERADIQRLIQEAGAEQTRLRESLSGLGGAPSSASAPSPVSRPVYKFDPATGTVVK